MTVTVPCVLTSYVTASASQQVVYFHVNRQLDGCCCILPKGMYTLECSFLYVHALDFEQLYSC